MAKAITIRRMGQTMKDGTIAKWCKKDGDHVKKGETVYEMEYDKASAEMEAPADGTLKIIKKEGETFPVGTVIGKIYQDGEKIEETPQIKAGPRRRRRTSS